jgi:hypothetical protein
MDKHTPEPWEARYIQGDLYSYAVYSRKGNVAVADRLLECDARLIVRAVNNHAALLAALERAIEAFADVSRLLPPDAEHSGIYGVAKKQVDKARAAIAKVKEEKS